MENLVLWQCGCYFGSSKVIDSFGYPNVVIIKEFLVFVGEESAWNMSGSIFLQLHTYNFSVM